MSGTWASADHESKWIPRATVHFEIFWAALNSTRQNIYTCATLDRIRNPTVCLTPNLFTGFHVVTLQLNNAVVMENANKD